jgi:hypothetical protein
MPNSPWPNIELNTTDPAVLRWLAQRQRDNGIAVRWLNKDHAGALTDDAELTAAQLDALADQIDAIPVSESVGYDYRGDFTFGLVGLEDTAPQTQTMINAALIS